MITLDGEVKLLDFGIARSHAAAAAGAEAEGVKGNVDFMSPEQARGQQVDRRSDLFSLGLVIYFCAARAPLYRGKSIYDRLLAAATGPGAAEQSFIAGLPPPLPDLLARALKIDPRRAFRPRPKCGPRLRRTPRTAPPSCARPCSACLAKMLSPNIAGWWELRR